MEKVSTDVLIELSAAGQIQGGPAPPGGSTSRLSLLCPPQAGPPGKKPRWQMEVNGKR